jgi:hypothetical protein
MGNVFKTNLDKKNNVTKFWAHHWGMKRENILIIPSFWTISNIKHKVRLKWPIWWTPIGFSQSRKKQPSFRTDALSTHLIITIIFMCVWKGTRESMGVRETFFRKCVPVKGPKYFISIIVLGPM